jgi:two-component system sensor histidine kinase/response regulator
MKTSVLIVEDEKHIRETILEILEISNYEVVSAENGIKALEILENYTPNIIICDIMMPQLSGTELLAKIRSNKKTKDIPFLFLTAKVAREDQRTAMDLGADDYITKPFKATELITAIDSRLKRFESLNNRVDKTFDAFKTNISKFGPHEVNTPLHGIIASAEIIMDNDDMLEPNEKKEFLRNIKISANQLHRNLKNLLLYLSEGYKNKNENLQKIDIKILKNEIIYRIKTYQEDNFNRVELDFEDLELYTQREHFFNAIYEFIDNGLKFSKDKVIVKGKNISNNKYQISIKDNGIGMIEDEINNIGALKQFNREKNEQQGLGLGLYLAINTLETLGAKVIVESKKDSGTLVKIIK